MSSHTGCGRGPHQEVLKPPSQQGQQCPCRTLRPRPGLNSKMGAQVDPSGAYEQDEHPHEGQDVVTASKGCRPLVITNSGEGSLLKASRGHPGELPCPTPSVGTFEDSLLMLGLHCLGVPSRRASPRGKSLFWAPPGQDTLPAPQPSRPNVPVPSFVSSPGGT